MDFTNRRAVIANSPSSSGNSGVGNGCAILGKHLQTEVVEIAVAVGPPENLTTADHRRHQVMDKLELTFKVEKDTKNTRRYQEEATDGPPIIGTR